MKCQKCEAGWPTRVDIYEGQSTKIALCDACLFADLPQETPTVATFSPGSQFYISPNGSESALPSYTS